MRGREEEEEEVNKHISHQRCGYIKAVYEENQLSGESLKVNHIKKRAELL